MASDNLTLAVSIIPIAYLDLGTGSYVAQILIATLLGGLVTLKIYWKKLIGIFTKKRERK